MSPIEEEEDKRQRSMKLCQLIYDRKTDKKRAVGFEIRKLLEAGVLINYQSKDRSEKTALHLAVENRDVICVKFLLKYKPNLEVKDEDDKTPVELAKSNGFQKILNVLLDSTVDVVNESYVEVIDFRSLTPQKIEAIKSRSTFKVLKLTNCPNAKTVWNKLNDCAYTKALNESSHLFFIAIETNETNIQNDHKRMKSLNLRRPMIVQLTSSNSRKPKVYFKDDMKDFVEITDTAQITQEEFKKAVQSGVESNLKLLVAALRSNLFGSFTSGLLDTKLNTNKDRSEAVNQFAKSNALCHRFFKLFDESQPNVDRIVAALSFRGDQSLLAFLDLPFDTKNEKLKLNENQQDILRVVDSSGCNLLMMAAEQRNLEAGKLLLRCGCDLNHSDKYDKRVSDICWQMKAFDCLAELIKAGSPFSNDFSLDELDESSEAYKRIKAMTEAINSFHENIKQGETEKVEKFIASHPLIKHAYDTKNKCALTVALQSNQVDIYSLLMSKGFEPGADADEYQSACSESKFKNKITKSHRNYFKEAFAEPHLKRLLKMFRLSFGSKDRAKCSKIILKMFGDLNEIDELIPILKICSLSDKLRIVFDFNCNSIVDMNPTRKSHELGLTSPSGFVYIGAKNHETEYCEVVGTLIHELTHYAIKLTYENGFKPYKVDDIENENRFEAITKETKKICDENPSSDAIVATVFSLHKETIWHQELIVRVPELLAQYKTNSEALEAAEQNTPELFHFYREETLKDVTAKSKVLLQEYLIGKINNQTGIARKIENSKIKFENVAIDMKASVNVITSNAPQFTLAMLSQINRDSSHIFGSLEQVATGNILEKIAKVNANEVSTTLIVDCIGLTQKYPESLQKLMKSMKNIKTVVLVMTEAEGSKVKENFPKVEFKTLTHEWAELTKISKINLLDQNVNFQGVEMKLNELVEPSSEAMNFFPLGSLVDCKDFKIGHELHQSSHKFYISRKFIEKGQASSRSFEELLQIETRLGAIIISDEAGSGKSVALFEIAESLHVAFPDWWVQFVDLKRHIEAFKSVEDHEKIESLEDFIVQNILKNEPEFDRELFLQMFRAGKTFVLFDGFDEISPNYKDLILHVLKSFQPESGNQIFVTTRPHLEADLERALGEFVFKIDELSEEDQIDFLSKYFQSAKPEMSHDNLFVLSYLLFRRFSKISIGSNIIGLPLLLRMTAEIFDDPINENLMHKVDSLNIASVFRKFVEKYFARWTNNENEISRNETVEFVMAGGVLEVHHRIAINHSFGENFMPFYVYESDAEKISRVGLIRYDKAEKTFQFIHETFAEYFVADFIWFHLNRKNRDPSHDCSKAVEILIEVLLSKRGFGVIKTFLDQTLETMNFNPSESFCKSVAKCLSEIVKSRYCFDFLLRSDFAFYDNLASLLLSIVKHVEKEVLLKLLERKGPFADTALLRAAKHGSKATISTLCDIITTRTDKPKEIFQNVDLYDKNVLFYAAINSNAEVMTILCENLNSVLTRDEIKILFQQTKYGGTVIETASKFSNDEIFLELISLLPNYLSPDEIKSLLLAVDDRNQNFFQRAAIDDTSKRLKVKFEVIKAKFNDEEQKISFYKPSAGPNMFHCAAQNQNEKIFETLIEYTLDVLSGDEIKSMLMQKDSNSYGSNVLHLVVEHYGNKIKLNELNSLFREHLSDDEIRSLLLEVNGRGQNCFRLATNNSELWFKVFGEIIGNLLPFEDQTRLLQESIHKIDIIRLVRGSYTKEFVSLETIKQLLTKKDEHGNNVFHGVASRGDVDEWNKLISFAQARFSSDEMKSFLFCSDEDGLNCLHRAVRWRLDTNMTGAIFKTIQAVLSVEDQKNFVRQKNAKNRNLFHLAVGNCYIKPDLFALYDDLSAILSNDEIKEMLKEKNSKGENILRPTPLGKISRNLIAFLQKVLTYDELKNFLLDVNYKGENTFSRAVGSSSKSEIKYLSKSFKGILNRDDQKKFFGIKSPNVFHLAVRNSEIGIFSTLYECLKAVFDADELKTLVSGSDNDGRNVLHLAAEDSSPFILKELFNLIQNELSIEDQRNLFKKCDNDGKNIFTFASRNEAPEVYSVVENFAKEILSKNQIEKLKNKKKKKFLFK